MEMDVFDAAERLAGKARRKVVVDVAHPAVEQIEHIGSDAELSRELISELQVDEARRLRASAMAIVRLRILNVVIVAEGF
jgi:hypothetical protein